MRKTLGLLLVGLLAVLTAQAAHAQTPSVQVKVENKSIDLPSIVSFPADSFFDVFVDLAPGSSTLSLSGFQAAVNLDASAAGSIVLLAPTLLTATPHAPLIAQNFTPDFGGDNGPGRASATAFTNGAGSSAAITAGAGLFRVPFQVLAGATPGHYNITIDMDQFAGTLLTDVNANMVSFAAVNGAIDLTSPAPPLASSIGLLPTPPVSPVGVVDITGGNGKYVSNKLSLVPAVQHGEVGLNHVGTEGRTLVMLWLDGASADIAALISHLRGKPGYEIALADAGSGDPLFGDIQALKNHYQGFSALVAFDKGIANAGFGWDLMGDPNVALAGVAAVPEPASLSGAALLGVLMFVGVRRRRAA
ncbi:MAG: hypothetical protein NTW19_17330 [Planctomycetota bacterium]|nr:hypothetical protein [Planctomycetota bacterium]